MRFTTLYRPMTALLFTALTATAAIAQQAQRNLAQEEANRQLVVEFYHQNFNQHQVDQATKVMADDYIQHNPLVPNGKAPFVSFFKGFFANNPNAKSKIVRTAADGDLVWLHIHATNGENDRGQAIIDVFRVKDGKIVEHWDVIQDVPEKAANHNTMF
jgi:predicted SnoaL-like aldol condensation-catalyzing enzyme